MTSPATRTAISAVIEDRTLHRKAIQQRLSESDRSFRVLTNNISDLFFNLDLDLRCSFWNRAAESLTGILASAVLGKRVAEAFSEGPGASKLEDVFREVLATRHCPQFYFSLPHWQQGLSIRGDRLSIDGRTIGGGTRCGSADARKRPCESQRRSSPRPFRRAPPSSRSSASRSAVYRSESRLRKADRPAACGGSGTVDLRCRRSRSCRV